ncbi:MAG: ABC transporter ATP-binding protein/permease [Arenicellales bacterium]|nr:ABC transporter ATP-binding protein/permease [Arenicellales bacterium]
MHVFRTELPSGARNDWRTLKSLLPYLREYTVRIGFALLFLVLAKLANVGVPVALKTIVDSLDVSGMEATLVTLPLALLVAYGLLRFSTILFQELRNAIFAKASQQSTRKIALKVFEHLHRLSLRFHLDRQTGGISRDIERGSRSIAQLLSFLVFSIIPTIFEIVVVCAILFYNFHAWFAVVTLATVCVYFVYTYKVTEWRIKFRVEMNQADSTANSTAVDSLINYETVKYFGNEAYEAKRYDNNMLKWEKASIKSQVSLALLNCGQGVIIGTGLTILMIMAANGVVAGAMTLGDFVMVNAFLIQLYIPLNFLGTIFREVKHSLTDMDKMFSLLDINAEIKDRPDAKELNSRNPEIRFDEVCFSYDKDRQILFDLDFVIPPGHKIAIVGSSGSGKSTIARLLYRFFDVTSGSISIDGQDLRDLSLRSLRSAIGIVPQDTVLFNETIGYNIRYGRPDATQDEVQTAAHLAHLDQFIESLPSKYDTIVGERGLKLSGGEKQRIAIARTVLKNPPILILDEATSQLDSKSEKAIQTALNEISENRTSLVIAHRLSTVIDSDQILVLDHGHIVERGTHSQLLAEHGRYAHMWQLQQETRNASGTEPLPVEKTADGLS